MNYQREYRIYPNKRQQEIIAKTFGVTRFIYNEMLAMKVEHYQNSKENLDVKPSDVRNKHKEYEWLFDKDLDGTAIANTWNLLNTAYKNFFQQYKKNGHGFPKFKKKKSRQSYTIRQTIKFIDDKHLSIPKCGKLKCVGDRVEGKIKSCCIKQMPSGKYFATILYEIPEPKKLEPSQFQVGIDLGLKEFAICSDGEVIANPRNTEKYADKLAWKQRLLARKSKNGNRRNKARIQVAKVYEKIRNSRKDFQQKLSTRLINENQVICLETLKASNMLKNHSLAKAIADASWSSFVSMLKYKSEWYGRSIVKISPYYPSSQLCCHCGHKFKGTKDLGVRVWKCPECHNVNERDLNASINILNEGLRKYCLRSGGPITHGDTGCNSNLDRECSNL